MCPAQNQQPQTYAGISLYLGVLSIIDRVPIRSMAHHKLVCAGLAIGKYNVYSLCSNGAYSGYMHPHGLVIVPAYKLIGKLSDKNPIPPSSF